MRIPREDPSPGSNRTLLVVGVIGILLGILILCGAATGFAWQQSPVLGYVIGFAMIFFGVLRVIRGRRGQRR
ncbi:MAG: hypothetical protein H7Z41_14350 [Cytophagales bacterium]|nr:hypothetical protein [Armatimonadota bacterium]